MYSIHMTDGSSETSAEIRAKLDPAVLREARYIAAIDDIEARGLRYSNQDFDVLSGARAAIFHRQECDRLGLPRDCGPNEFWLAKARERRQTLPANECPYCGSINTRRLTKDERECWELQENVVRKNDGLHSNNLPTDRIAWLAKDLVNKAGCEVFKQDAAWFQERAERGWTATEISRAFIRANFAKGEKLRRSFLTALTKLGAKA